MNAKKEITVLAEQKFNILVSLVSTSLILVRLHVFNALLASIATKVILQRFRTALQDLIVLLELDTEQSFYVLKELILIAQATTP